MTRTKHKTPKEPMPLHNGLPAGRKLTIYMLDGTASGPMTIEIGNWSGIAIFCPLAQLKRLLHRKEFSTPGVYLLHSQSNRTEFDGSVYFGETEGLAARLRQHIADRDFESVVCFSSKELTKAHIKYLEARLVQLARDANTSLVENGNTPRGAHLSEPDVAVMESFIGEVKLILRVVGIRALITAAPHSRIPATKFSGEQIYHIGSRDLTATMVELENGFVVRTGSEANLETSKSLAPGWRNLRQKLLDARILKPSKDKLVFAEDAIFSSPSAAAAVVLGRQAPGPISWRLEDGRTTYKDVQAAQARG